MKDRNEFGNIIRNKRQLLSNGNISGRRVAMNIIENSLRAIDTYAATRRNVSLEDNVLRIKELYIDLSTRGDIYVVGAGKASFPIAKALEDILGDRIREGIILEKRAGTLKRIRVIEAGHPIPDENGLKGALQIMELTKRMKEEDVVFCAFTGGSSSLMTLPAESISLRDVQVTTDLLLKSGAPIQEINAVRKHLSRIKGGRLAVAIHPAEIINLTVSDVIGDWDALDVITCPTVPDTSTFQHAVTVLKKYKLLKAVPPPVRIHLEKADPAAETPKDFSHMRVHTVMLATNEDACQVAQKSASEMGFNTAVLSSMIEGESREVGVVLAGIAREIEKHGSPFPLPVVLISGGETTVTIESESGEGGPNQEFVLGAAIKIERSENITVAAVGTDGTDGPTNIAGGITDGFTLERARKGGIDVFEELIAHNSSHVLRQLGDAIYTGATGTNVMDLRVIVIQSHHHEELISEGNQKE